MNYLEHWPRKPPPSKIWWSSAISGGPVRNKIRPGHFSGLPDHCYHCYPLFWIERQLKYNLLNNSGPLNFSGLSDYCYQVFWWSEGKFANFEDCIRITSTIYANTSYQQMQRNDHKHPNDTLQQTRGIHLMLFQCWPTVFNAGPKLKQQWVNAPFAGPYLSTMAPAANSFSIADLHEWTMALLTHT